MSELYQPAFADPLGGLMRPAGIRHLMAAGTVVPVDATAGYQNGCIFFHTDGSAGDTLYVNNGSATSCLFQPLLTSGAATILAGGVVVNEAGGDYDFRVETDTNANFFTIDGAANLGGALSIGAAIPTNPQALVAVLPPANATGVTANQDYYHFTLLPGGATVIPTGTAAIAASLNVAEPNLTATGTITVAATVRIADAPTEGGLNFALWVDSGITRLDGQCFIGDTSNASDTLGLTINQGAADDHILTLKSSDVSHTGTGFTEADTYGFFSKWVAANGGLAITGVDDAADQGLVLRGAGTTATATRSTSGTGPVTISGHLITANALATCGADKNIVVFKDHTTTRFILDSDGDSFQDVGTAWTNFDEHDDLTLLNSMSHFLSRPGNAISEAFGGWLKANKERLTELNLVHFNEDTDSRPFVNMSKLSMLLVGAVRQSGLVIKQLNDKIDAIAQHVGLALGQ